MNKSRYLVKFKNESIDSALRQSGGFSKLFDTIEYAVAFAIKEGFNINLIKVIKVDTSECLNVKELLFVDKC